MDGVVDVRNNDRINYDGEQSVITSGYGPPE